jgi:hypothetical protein
MSSNVAAVAASTTQQTWRPSLLVVRAVLVSTLTYITGIANAWFRKVKDSCRVSHVETGQQPRLAWQQLQMNRAA